jgi:predicted DsbA family dithiol-disulfide isomerase
VKIDFISDVTCPWCAIGLAALEQAVARLGSEVKVELRLQPFELNPGMPPGGEDLAHYVTRKYGASAAELSARQALIKQRAAEVGLHFGPRTRVWNTFDAHRLLHWAGETAGPAVQKALKQALFKAYFTDGQNPGDHALLERLAGEAGLDAAQARAILAGDAYAAEVREREHFYQQHGIHSVPSVIVNGRHLIQGGQPPEVFEQALRQIATKSEAASA